MVVSIRLALPKNLPRNFPKSEKQDCSRFRVRGLSPDEPISKFSNRVTDVPDATLITDLRSCALAGNGQHVQE
jgi:hypothetical protein